jgi:hypothetical protein
MSFDASHFLGGLFLNSTSSPPPEKTLHVPPATAEEPPVEAGPEAGYQSDRSRMFLADAPAFFRGWRRDPDGWSAPWQRN